MTRPNMILFAADNRGVYIPKYFAESIIEDSLEGVSKEDLEILRAGPDNESYWNVWDEVCNNVKVIDKTTNTKYVLYQDGDLWLVPEDMIWDDVNECFRYEDETQPF